MASKKQQTISSFFTKPKATPPKLSRDDTSQADFEVPEPKRRKTSADTFTVPAAPSEDTPEEESDLRPLPLNDQNARSLPTRGAVAAPTSKYLFSSSHENEAEHEKQDPRKQELHRRFVKKLGNPDSINEIKR